MSPLAGFGCSLPTAVIPQDVDANETAASFVQELAHLSEDDFTKDAVWRDVYALTGTLRTFYSATSVFKAWKETSEKADLSSFALNPRLVRVSRLPGGSSWVEATFSFETNASPATSCSAILALVPGNDGKWRIWVMRTILEQLKGQGNVDELDPVGDIRVVNGHVTKFDCVVIGGGQAGLSLGGRLKALGLSCVVLDKYAAVGDNWKQRYSSVRLHTTREYAHLPFERTFPEIYPEWLAKDDLAEGYQNWVKKYGINVWTGTTAKKGTWDSSNKLWTLEIEQKDGLHSITCSNIVVAGGAGGHSPVMPEYPGREDFEGEVLHSAQYKDASKWKGKHAVVVGCANTGHDIAEDMVAAGCASVTMVQRSRTYVLPRAHYKATVQVLYNATVPTTIADRAFVTQPIPIASLISKKVLHNMASKEPEFYDGLEKAGFRVERYGDLIEALFTRCGGHYMDVGASVKIAKGLIKIYAHPSTGLTCYTPRGLSFSDDTYLPADVVVFATGFKSNMRYLIHDIFGAEVARKMGDYWGLDEEAEIKGAFKPSGQQGLWYHGGTMGQARYMSRFIALSIKAEKLGTPLRIYGKTP